MWTRIQVSGEGHGVATDSADNILVTGSVWNGANLDIWVRKYTP
jgi:hypothetical protein